ncbi:hypothetical protein [Candidatus Uabimicrobium sp. HlEnr_7]|uniref:hypothetical protein n=1 Tax=Candidatus Uabimicrobium helgolandensis TaxID=3095367 RepID=UPI003557C657
MRVLNILMVIAMSLGLCGCPTTPDGGYYPYEPVPSGGHKLQGVKVAFVADFDAMGANEVNQDLMFATVQDRLGEYLTIVTNPNQANALIYLSLKTSRRYDPATGSSCWHATVGTHAVRKETAQQYWRFQLSSGERYKGRAIDWGCENNGGYSARDVSVRSVSQAVADKIIGEIYTSTTIPDTSDYEIKFMYDTRSQKTKFRDTIRDLEGTLNIAPGGAEAPGYLVYQVKNIRNGLSQADIINLIQEKAEYNELVVNCISSSPGILVFESQGGFVDEDY